MPTALVTGATGFTGSALAARLVRDGYDVTAFARKSSHVHALESLGVEIRRVDITDAEDVASHMQPFDRVFHLAGSYREEHADKEVFRRVNVDATRHLLEAAGEHGVGRFVHCSTVGVQGAIEAPPANEDYRLRPGDHYQESKLEGEQLALDFFRKGLPGSVVRPVGIYGPGDRRFLKLFKSVQSGWFVMIGNGRTLYHMTYIDDLVQGFVLVGDSPTALNEVFTIGGPEYTTIEELVRMVAGALGVEPPRWRIPFLPVYAAAWTCEMLCRPLGISPPLYRRRVEFFHLDRAFDISKARRLLGYDPKWSLSAGLTATAEAYRTAGWLPPSAHR
jgi:nucleoside-diphosphate-sugar epimerase